MLTKDLQRGIREMRKSMSPDRDSLPVFSWTPVGGAECLIPCVPGSLGRRVELDGEGNSVEVDLVLVVDRTEFHTFDSSLVTMDSELVSMDDDRPVPVSGRRTIFRGVEYTIVLAKESGPQSHFELSLKEEGSDA